MSYLADAAFECGHRPIAQQVLSRLEPYGGLSVYVPGLVCYGAADRYLGRLYSTLGHHDAALAAFEALEVQRVAVLTPYIDAVSLPMVRYLEKHGKDVVGLTSFRIEDDNDMCRIPTRTVIEAALEADRPDAEAIFISCTAVRAVDCIERIEDALGKAVISSNLALFWQALRATGYKERVTGYGRLLRL